MQMTEVMMKIEAPSEERTGCHESSIIKSIHDALYPPKTPQLPDDDPALQLRFLFGYAFEKALAELLGDRLGPRPEPRQVDGVWMSPDGLSDGRIDELKLTWAKADKEPDQMLRWLWQAKAYCYGYQCPLARIHVFYVNGYYNHHPSQPVYRAFDIIFSEQELAENWQMLMRHAKAEGMVPNDVD